MRLVRLLMGLALLIWAVPVSATTYYVSQLGNDLNSCAAATTTTQTANKLTIADGVACASAGDTVYIRGGTYTGNANTIDSQTYTVNSGTSYANAITISGYPGETVILQPPYNFSGVRLTTGTPHYLIIQDLRIDMINTLAFAEGVFMYQAHHVRMLRIDVAHGYGFGIHIADSTPYVELLNSRVHDVGQPGSGSTDGHGLYWSGDNATITGNEIDHNQGYGIHFYCNILCPGVSPTNGIISGNNVHHNGLHGSPGFGIVVTWGSNNEVSNNLVYRNAGGIQIYTQSTGTKVYHNTAYGNTPDQGLVMQYYASGATVTNNILYGNAENYHDYGGTGINNLTGNIQSDPGFTDVTKNDFTLAGSAALNVGPCPDGITSDYLGTSRPQGASCDAGAYEKATGGSNPPVITTATLPDAQQGSAYSQIVCATNGTTPYAWTKPTGSLPTGVSLSNTTSTCVTLSGTLSAASTFTFTLLVTDAAALTDSQFYTVIVSAVTTTCSGGTGAWTLRTNSCVGGGSSNGTATATTGAVTTVAGDIAFCAVADDLSQTQTPVSDSKSNTWTLMGTAKTGEYGRAALYYSKLSSVGSSHTFSAAPVGGALSFPAIQCAVFQGAQASPLDAVATGTGAVATASIQTSPLAPVQTWTLSIAGLQAEDANTVTATGFTVYQRSYSLDKSFGVALAWAIQPTTTVILPSWSWASPMSVSAVAGTFLSGASYVPLGRRRMR